jgi:hypothetical protein
MSAVPGAGSDAAADVPSGNGSGSGSGSGTGEGTLGDVMRGPSVTAPDVVVLDSLPEAPVRKDVLDPNEDLWLSTADG